MNSNMDRHKSLDYYITVVDTDSNDNIKFLGRDRNDQYHLYESYNNSRTFRCDNENFLNEWLSCNYYRFKNLIDSTHQNYVVMSIERIKEFYDKKRNKEHTVELSGQC